MGFPFHCFSLHYLLHVHFSIADGICRILKCQCSFTWKLRFIQKVSSETDYTCSAVVTRAWWPHPLPSWNEQRLSTEEPLLRSVPHNSTLGSRVFSNTGFLKLMSLGRGNLRKINFQVIFFLKMKCLSINMEIIDSENLSIPGQNNRKLNVEQCFSFLLLHLTV